MKPINATWTQRMYEDVKYFGIFEYKFESKEERKIVERNFNVEHILTDKIYYSIDNKILRKLKLFKISDNEIYKIIQKILDNSIVANVSDVLEYKLSEELAKSLDKEILKELFKLKN